ncbi:MAG: polysulfide reductase NrfD [Deltaproteobacteria bacterium]|nr:polysulfide reductase NrfD [Deltaproteobacteria bacterium]
MSWIVFILALLLSAVWGIMFLRQMKTGLTTTALDDKFTWGLYVQGFFFFSALAGGILIFIAVVMLFEMQTLRPLVDIGAAVAFGCLVAAGLLLGSDLGKPFRGMKILSGKNFASPLTWDFYMLSLCGILIVIFLLGLVPGTGAITTIWSVLCLMAALGFVMIHTLFFLSRVGAGFRSQPFLGLDTLAQSLWGGAALITLISLSSGIAPFNMVRLLLILTVLTLIPLIGAHIAYLSNKRKGFDQKKILALDTLILLILVIIQIFAPQNNLLLTVASLLILCAVFLEKSHLMRQYQITPTLPLPYSRYEELPKYAPTTNEWFLALGSVGVCVFLSSIIIFLKIG